MYTTQDTYVAADYMCYLCTKESGSPYELIHHLLKLVAILSQYRCYKFIWDPFQ